MPPRTDWSRAQPGLTPRQKLDAQEALALLKPSGLSLTEAARLALTGRVVTRITVADAIHRFKLFSARKVSRRGAPLRPATLAWYDDFLLALERDFADQPLDGITRDRFGAWLRALQTGATARASTARACRALWRWARLESPPLVTEDVTLGHAFASPIRAESARLVLTVEQCGQLLAAAGRHRSAYALMLFAGLRPEELAGTHKDRLLWQHVNVSERWIRVPETVAKTGRTRLLEDLPPALWHWLEPRALTAPVAHATYQYLQWFARRTLGIATWPFDCFRHTAASYLLATVRDPGRVSEWIGHEGRTRLLHATYRGQLTLARTQVNHAMGLRFHALRPPELDPARARFLAALAARIQKTATTPARPARRG